MTETELDAAEDVSGAALQRELHLPLEVILTCAQVLREHWAELDEEDRAVVLGQIRHAVKQHRELLDQLEKQLTRAMRKSERVRFGCGSQLGAQVGVFRRQAQER